MNENAENEIRDIIGNDFRQNDFDKERDIDKIIATIAKSIAEELINAGIFDRT